MKVALALVAAAAGVHATLGRCDTRQGSRDSLMALSETGAIMTFGMLSNVRNEFLGGTPSHPTRGQVGPGYVVSSDNSGFMAQSCPSCPLTGFVSVVQANDNGYLRDRYPREVPGRTFSGVFAALDSAGKIHTWGEPSSFFGLADEDNHGFVSIAVDGAYFSALRRDGHVYCWGGADSEKEKTLSSAFYTSAWKTPSSFNGQGDIVKLLGAFAGQTASGGVKFWTEGRHWASSTHASADGAYATCLSQRASDVPASKRRGHSATRTKGE